MEKKKDRILFTTKKGVSIKESYYIGDTDIEVPPAFKDFQQGVRQLIIESGAVFPSIPDKEDFEHVCYSAYLQACKRGEGRIIPKDKNGNPIENLFKYGYEVAKNRRASFITDKELKTKYVPLPEDIDEEIELQRFDSAFIERGMKDTKEYDQQIHDELQKFQQHWFYLSSERLHAMPISLQNIALTSSEKKNIACWEWMKRRTIAEKKQDKSTRINSNDLRLRLLWQIVGDSHFWLLMSCFAGYSIKFPSLEEQEESLRREKVYELHKLYENRKKWKSPLDIPRYSKDIAEEVNLTPQRIHQILKEEKEWRQKEEQKAAMSKEAEPYLRAYLMLLERILKELNETLERLRKNRIEKQKIDN